MKISLQVGFVVAGLAHAVPAYAYLDPGTGSILLQGLIAGLAGAAVVARLYWFRVKSFFQSLFGGAGGAEELIDETPGKPARAEEKAES